MDSVLKAAASSDVKHLARLISRGADINVEHETLRTTPMHFAAAVGNLPMIEVLLEAKANISAITWNGSTALHVASQSALRNALLF